MTREEVVQAALKVERWCAEHKKIMEECDCPFADGLDGCGLFDTDVPAEWNLEEFLRTRGMKHGKV